MGEYSICIIGVKQPTRKEAEDFCKKDMIEFGYDNVSSVLEISKEEASNFFDMENEQNFPVFGVYTGIQSSSIPAGD